jgi:hypothetical protein
MATGTSSSDNRNGNHLQNILTSIGLRTKNPLLEFLLGFSSTSIVVAILVAFLGKPAMQPIEHLLQVPALWFTIVWVLLGTFIQVTVFPGILLTSIEQLINTRVALIILAIVFGFSFRETRYGNFLEYSSVFYTGLTGLFQGLLFIAFRSNWLIFGNQFVISTIQFSTNDISRIFYDTARILEQSKPSSTSLTIKLTSGPSFDGGLQSEIWLVMNITSVFLIIFLVLKKRKLTSIQNERKSF